MRRTLDLVRLSQVVVVVVAITLATEWTALVLSAHRRDWTRTTAATTALLALFTVGTAVALGQLRQARRVHPDRLGYSPDWLCDAMLAGHIAARALPVGRRAMQRFVRFTDRCFVGAIRRHRLGAAAVFSVAFGVAIDTPQVVIERYSARFAIVFFAISACSSFAFVMLAGSYINLAGRDARHPNAGVVAAVSAAIAVPVAASFRNSIWPLFGVRDGGVGDLAKLLILAAGFGAVLGYGAGVIAQHAANRRLG